MKSVIIFSEFCHIEGGIYEGISYHKAVEEVGEDNILFYIPLRVSGKTYADKKADLIEKSHDYQSTWAEFCGYSYGEIADIEAFFRTNGRRYGLLKEFEANCIC